MRPSDTVRGSVFLGLSGVHEGLIAIRWGKLLYVVVYRDRIDRLTVRFRRRTLRNVARLGQKRQCSLVLLVRAGCSCRSRRRSSCPGRRSYDRSWSWRGVPEHVAEPVRLLRRARHRVCRPCIRLVSDRGAQHAVQTQRLRPTPTQNHAPPTMVIPNAATPGLGCRPCAKRTSERDQHPRPNPEVFHNHTVAVSRSTTELFVNVPDSCR